MNIRLIEETDAEAILAMNRQLDEETDFMLMEPGERGNDPARQKKLLEQIIEDPNSAMWVLENEKKLFGFLGAFGNKPKRVRHVAYIVIGILQAATRQGYGTRLFRELERWAKDKEIHRLELTVMIHNEAGLALYKKMGFEVEGVKRHSLLVNGSYVDEYYMSKLI